MRLRRGRTGRDHRRAAVMPRHRRSILPGPTGGNARRHAMSNETIFVFGLIAAAAAMMSGRIRHLLTPVVFPFDAVVRPAV